MLLERESRRGVVRGGRELDALGGCCVPTVKRACEAKAHVPHCRQAAVLGATATAIQARLHGRRTKTIPRLM